VFTCCYCGLENTSETAKICSDCGPSKKWSEQEVDKPTELNKYQVLLSEFVFDSHSTQDIKAFSDRARDRFKISIVAHREILGKLEAQKSEIAALMEFQLEFEENVTDAYAGHDTYLKFKLTNTSADEMFKAELNWDDPETPEDKDLSIVVRNYIKPGQFAIVGGSHVFNRIGFKEIPDLQITISNQLLDSATFRVESFRLKVDNPDQRITQNISTHNQISIEGRGVVDASGMGTEKNTTASGVSTAPKWKKLSFSYVPSAAKAEETVPMSETKLAAIQLMQQQAENFEAVQASRIEFNKDDLLSVLKAAEQGNAGAQNNLAKMYLDGSGVVQNDQEAVKWFRLAAEQGDADAQCNLGFMYANGRGVAQNDQEAIAWYRLAAEQGDAVGQGYLGFMYANGSGVAQNDQEAIAWYRQAAEQGNDYAQCNLGVMYANGSGVAQNDQEAIAWYRLAADQGFEDAQCNLGFMYANGRGVAQNDQEAIAWYRLAAEQGFEDAIEFLEALDNSPKPVHWPLSTNTPTEPPTEGYGSWDYGYCTYTGNFKNGQRNGLGEMIWSGEYLGHKYVGNFENGLLHGQGTYTFPDGSTNVGQFKADKFVDYAYDGATSNGMPHGVGKMTWQNGEQYKGDFVNGMRDGLGELVYASGTTVMGRFEKNEFIRPATFAECVKIGWKIGNL